MAHSAALFRGLASVDFDSSGIPSEQKYLTTYLERRKVNAPDNWDCYIVASLFRIASILQGIGKRAAVGTAANVDASEFGSKASRLAALAWQLASRL
ncbi:hypothetical protein [Bradyrhizobium sp. USDA 3315]